MRALGEMRRAGRDQSDIGQYQLVNWKQLLLNARRYDEAGTTGTKKLSNWMCIPLVHITASRLPIKCRSIIRRVSKSERK